MKNPSIPMRERLMPPLWLLTLFGVAIACWALWELQNLVSMMIVGYAIAYVIDPVLRHLERIGIRRSFGFFALLLLAAILLFLLTETALPTIEREYNLLLENFPGYVIDAKAKATSLLKEVHIPGHPLRIDQVMDNLPNPSADTLKGTAIAIGNAFLKGFSLTLTIVNLALLPFIVFYLSIDFAQFHHRLLLLFSEDQRAKVRRIGREIDGYVSAFVRGQLLVGCILIVLLGIGLGIVGIELWFLIAVVTGLGNFIPYVGYITGIIFASLMALVTYGDFSHLFYTWIVFAVVQPVESTFITPYILGEKVGLSPLAILLALFAGGQLFGLLGVFLAIPVTAALRVLMHHSYSALVKS